jgi:hypothetical protein
VYDFLSLEQAILSAETKLAPHGNVARPNGTPILAVESQSKYICELWQLFNDCRSERAIEAGSDAAEATSTATSAEVAGTARGGRLCTRWLHRSAGHAGGLAQS